MPIVRTYACEECGHFMEVTLRFDQADDPAPACPHCAQAAAMRQEFKPVAIGGSTATKAKDLALTIAHEDYGVADIETDHRRDSIPKVRFKDQGNAAQASAWGAANATLEHAVAIGRQTRLKYGSGLDILQNALKTGEQPDLIEVSKKRAMKVW